MGASGKVFLASNKANDVVAIKIITRTLKTMGRVDAEIQPYRQLTSLAKQADCNRIILWRDEIYPSGREYNESISFDEIDLVLQPITPRTFHNLIETATKGGRAGMTKEAAKLFHDALQGIGFLHNNGWIHCDLKPLNIGILDNPPRPVLLDLDQARYLTPGAKLLASPG
jgi:serine/threonine protein kinase